MTHERLLAAPRCLARTRSGTECQSPAVKRRKRCRMHGGTNSGAPKENKNAHKHGIFSREALDLQANRDAYAGLRNAGFTPDQIADPSTRPLLDAMAAKVAVRRAIKQANETP